MTDRSGGTGSHAESEASSVISPRVVKLTKRPVDLSFIVDEQERSRVGQALAMAPKSVLRPGQKPSRPIRRALLGYGGWPVDGASAFFDALSTKSENTEATYATSVAIWVRESQSAGLDPLYMDFDTLQEYRDEVRLGDHGVSPGTWNQGLHALKRFNDATVRAGHVPESLLDDSDWRALQLDEARIFWPRVVDPQVYRVFRSVGLSAMTLRGRMTHAGYAMRTPVRDRLYADFLLAHGLRRAEASHMTLFDLPRRRPGMRTNDMHIPASIAKWRSGRTVPEERSWAGRLEAYHDGEWFTTVETMQKALRRQRDRWLLVEHVDGRFEATQTRLTIRGRQNQKVLANLTKGERMSLVCTPDVARSIAREPGMGEALGAMKDSWIVPCGIFPGTRSPMIGPEAWSLTFRQANARVASALNEYGHPPGQRVTPHLLRHTYAVNTLIDLMTTISQEDREYLASISAARATDTAVLRRRYMNPLVAVQQRLGHRSLKTTIVYLQYSAAQADAGLVDRDSWIETFLEGAV